MPLPRSEYLGFFLALAVGLGLPETLRAQTPPCSAEEYRQFDFWIGNWRVETPSGQVAGYNTIERTNDCFLHESYATPTGYTFWETSRDGGTTWQVAFDGHYQREN